MQFKFFYFALIISLHILTCTTPILATNIVDSNLFDVIVVGGGVAGLSAMSALTNASKLNTLLLEGGNRLGGRAYTIPFGSNGHIELGAQVEKSLYILKRFSYS